MSDDILNVFFKYNAAGKWNSKDVAANLNEYFSDDVIHTFVKYIQKISRSKYTPFFKIKSVRLSN